MDLIENRLKLEGVICNCSLIFVYEALVFEGFYKTADWNAKSVFMLCVVVVGLGFETLGFRVGV